jgi:hypothetical protein
MKMVIASTVSSSWVSSSTDGLSGVLVSGVSCAHVTIENEPITAMLNGTLGTSRHGVSTTIVSASGDPSGADGGNFVSPDVSEIETVVHATGGAVPRRAVVPGELRTSVPLEELLRGSNCKDLSLSHGRRRGSAAAAGWGW